MFDINTMFKQRGGPVTINSTLINVKSLKPETIDAIRNASICATVNKAYELWGPGQALTVRDLLGNDLGYGAALENFLNVSNAAAAAWNVINTGAFTVPTATVIGIYGISIGWNPVLVVNNCPVSAFRIDVGGSRHAQWNIQPLDVFTPAAATVNTFEPQTGITRSPIIVAEDMTVTIYEWTRTAALAYQPCWLGVAVEKQGVTLKP